MRVERDTMEGLEEDPAAAFLAREQDELAGIADDTLGFTADTMVRLSNSLVYSLDPWRLCLLECVVTNASLCCIGAPGSAHRRASSCRFLWRW